MKPPRRWKTDEELSVEEWLELGRTDKRPESDEYVEYRRKVHEEAGLEDDDAEKPLDEMSADDHLAAIKRPT